MAFVKTVVLGQPPAALEALIAHRRQLGQDLFDEVWQGTYHIAPAPHSHHGLVASDLRAALRAAATRVGLRGSDPFNLGEAQDYRVPDGGFHRSVPDGVWVATAAIVLEVVSPDDETFEKFGFYAAHGVDEIFVAEPDARRVRCFVLTDNAYVESVESQLLDLTCAEVASQIDWPA